MLAHPVFRSNMAITVLLSRPWEQCGTEGPISVFARGEPSASRTTTPVAPIVSMRSTSSGHVMVAITRGYRAWPLARQSWRARGLDSTAESRGGSRKTGRWLHAIQSSPGLGSRRSWTVWQNTHASKEACRSECAPLDLHAAA